MSLLRSYTHYLVTKNHYLQVIGHYLRYWGHYFEAIYPLPVTLDPLRIAFTPLLPGNGALLAATVQYVTSNDPWLFHNALLLTHNGQNTPGNAS